MMNINDIHKQMMDMIKAVRQGQARQGASIDELDGTLVSIYMERIFECEFTAVCTCEMCNE